MNRPQKGAARWRLAQVAGFDDYPAYKVELDKHRNFVSACFDRVMGLHANEAEIIEESQRDWTLLWQEFDPDVATVRLDAAGFQDIGFTLDVTAMKHYHVQVTSIRQFQST